MRESFTNIEPIDVKQTSSAIDTELLAPTHAIDLVDPPCGSSRKSQSSTCCCKDLGSSMWTLSFTAISDAEILHERQGLAAKPTPSLKPPMKLDAGVSATSIARSPLMFLCWPATVSWTPVDDKTFTVNEVSHYPLDPMFLYMKSLQCPEQILLIVWSDTQGGCLQL